LSKKPPSVLADVVESLLAVVYLESGFKKAYQIIERFWTPLMDQMVEVPKDAKSALQEWAHRHHKSSPVYELIQRSGPDHKPIFTVQVSLSQSLRATAQGISLKQAEKKAAKALIDDLNKSSTKSNESII